MKQESLIKIIDSAIGKLPEFKYIYGVLGLFAALSLCYGVFNFEIKDAVIGALAIMFLMVLVVLFCEATKIIVRNPLPVLVFIWVALILFLIVLATTVSSLFLTNPKQATIQY